MNDIGWGLLAITAALLGMAIGSAMPGCCL